MNRPCREELEIHCRDQAFLESPVSRYPVQEATSFPEAPCFLPEAEYCLGEAPTPAALSQVMVETSNQGEHHFQVTQSPAPLLQAPSAEYPEAHLALEDSCRYQAHLALYPALPAPCPANPAPEDSCRYRANPAP